MSTKSTAPAAAVPPAAKKLVQAIREVVNSSEAEIYATLKDCGMDPDEALNRLLTQDTFQEVKSKRDKKKEAKGLSELRYKAVNASRGARGGADRGRRNSSYVASPPDNLANRSSISGSAAVPVSSNDNYKPVVQSSNLSKSSKGDGHSVPSQPSTYTQSSWQAMPGHMSMADIVKMGKPQTKPPIMDGGVFDKSHIESNAGYHSNMQCVGDFDRESSLQDPVQISGTNNGEENNYDNYHNNWSPRHRPSLAEPSNLSDLHNESLESSGLFTGAVYNHDNSHLDENNPAEMSNGNQLPLDSSESYADVSDNYMKKASAYEAQQDTFDCNEVEEAVMNFQHLSVESEEPKVLEDNPAVIIPDHLQVSNVECAHLSFGSFGSGAFSGLLPAHGTINNIEMPSAVEEPVSANQSDERNHEYYDNAQPKSLVDEDADATLGRSIEGQDLPPASQPDPVRDGSLDGGLQYNLLSASNHTYSDPSQSIDMEHQKGSNQTQNMSNISHISNLLHANGLQSSFLAQNPPPLRSFDISLAPLLAQSMAKYNSPVPSTSASTATMQENAKPDGGLSQLVQNLPSNNNIPTGPPLPQQLAMHHYSQPTLSLSPFTNLVGYPYLPPSYTYLPSTFQQPYSSNGPFHLSASTMPSANMKYSLPQYKNGISPASLSPSLASAYANFGASSNLPANYSLNNSAATTPMNLGLDEGLSAQFKDASHYMALQQHGDSSAMWQAAGSRTAVPVPSSTLYGYQGQSQQGNFRQGPLASQLSSSLGYANFYQSQAVLAQEQRPQNPASGNMVGSQAGPSQPSHQLWQHSY